MMLLRNKKYVKRNHNYPLTNMHKEQDSKHQLAFELEKSTKMTTMIFIATTKKLIRHETNSFTNKNQFSSSNFKFDQKKIVLINRIQ